MLNRSKGPAVHSLRAQADKKAYSQRMREIMESEENLTIRQGEVDEILVEGGIFKGIKTHTGVEYLADVCVLCTGTYLNSRCITGETSTYTGPNGLQAATHLSDSLKNLGLNLRRFKTGTPARMDGKTIDYEKMQPQYGDDPITPFSFTNLEKGIQKQQALCYLTYTNEKTHKIINDNIDRSPLFSGYIEGTGPRYCPSIEDKVVRFHDKERHQVFIEPEGLYTDEMYVGGMSSSLPEDVQMAMYATVPGLEHAKIVRNAYAIEYDCIDPLELNPSLELKKITGLFSAGQANGSSGYEEAAAQGIIAGINAARKITAKPPIIIGRSEGYIGVLIDDLVTKGTNEPYRMMTSRAEYRLLLRQDNADERLTPIGYEIGLISEERMQHLKEKMSRVDSEVSRMKETFVGDTNEVQSLLEKYESTPLNSGISLAELIKRPELDYEKISPIDKNRPLLSDEVKEEAQIRLRYEGYIERQKKQVEQALKLESRIIPDDIDYDKIESLRLEARQKLKDISPKTIGQASRISGVSPADISVLQIYIKTI